MIEGRVTMIERRANKSERRRLMFMSALLASASAIPVHAATDAATGTASTTAVQEVIITATKRSQSLQNVPISVQALTPKVLEQHQVMDFEDYAKLLPSVSFQSNGPGQSQPYFRGISSGADGLHSGSQPATGIYLDETPVTTIGNGLDLHLYDISRVEALSGPQGTLFGASSLSGTLRIITNQPDPSKFSASFDVQGDKYGPGGPGGVADAYVNIPITDKIAIRLVGFGEHDGGYIDNVYKERDYTLSVPLNTPNGELATNNAAYVKKDYNTVDTFGGRAALRVELNDSWTLTPSAIYQNQDAEGSFLYNHNIGDLKTSDFAPEYNRDSWYQTAMTIQGKISNWDILYSGGYFNRVVDNAFDYSYYSVAYDNMGETSFVTFPTHQSNSPTDANPADYLNPNQQVTAQDQYTKETHELRISSPTTYPLKAIGGVFYERQTDDIRANYLIPGFAASGNPLAIGSPANAGNGYIPGAGDDIYYTDIRRIDRDFALFGELSYDILPSLTATIGGRYFTNNNTLDGFSGFIGSTESHKGSTEYGETHKANLSWKITPEAMVYVTYSTGFRPGGPNRRDVLGNPPVTITPFGPDTLTNYELGWKTTWLDGRLRVNGAIFDEEWHDVQFSLSPTGANGITAIFNVGYARSRGVEGDVVYKLGDHLTLSGSGTVLEAQLTQNFCSQKDTSGNCIPGGYAYAGEELPIAPRYKLNATARYEFNILSYKSFIQAAVQTQGLTTSALVSGNEALLGPTPAFTTVDMSAGFSKDNWTVQAFVQNMFDERGILGVTTDCSVTYCAPYKLYYPTKPQFFGLKFGAKY